ncbi:MAG: hypothetical protein IJR49_04565 [Treponema sp.]|nr:hypothetical protein [Treponema sp.]
MKKIIALLATIVFTCSAIFATSFELDINYQFGIISTVKPGKLVVDGKKTAIPKKTREKYSYMSPFGLTANGNIYFAGFNNVDIGLNIGAGFDISFDLTITDFHENKSSIRKDVIHPLVDAKIDASFIGIGGIGKIGLAVRHNINEKRARYFAPAFILGGTTFITKKGATAEKTRAIYYGLDLDLGYRYLVTDHVGIDLGLNLDAPMSVTILKDSTPSEKMKGIGVAFKLYAGITFDFGK